MLTCPAILFRLAADLEAFGDGIPGSSLLSAEQALSLAAIYSLTAKSGQTAHG